MTNTTPIHIETERKFLIKKPDEEELLRQPGCIKTQITQTYLICQEHVTERIRKRVFPDSTVYTHTVKQRISPMSSVETETVISPEEYKELKQRRDPKRRRIKKLRYVLPCGGHIAEIDVYPFWERQAIMEIELGDEAESFELPGCVSVIREVTGDKAYSNNSISRKIPDEDE